MRGLFSKLGKFFENRQNLLFHNFFLINVNFFSSLKKCLF